MGKRELLIVLAFVVAGTVAFQVSAPPAKESAPSGFSLSKLIGLARRGVRSNQSYTAPVRALTFAIDAEITDVRLVGSAGPIKVLGESRADLALDLAVASTGDSEAAAIAIANKTTVRTDRVGGVLTLQIEFPKEETQTSQLVLKLPQRLAVQLDGARETSISNVRAVELTSPARGTTTIDHVAELVRGEQSSGAITLTAVHALRMTLTRTRSRISDAAGPLDLDVRDGDLEIAASRGALTVDERRGKITIRGHRGPVKVSGSEGRVRIESATDEVRLDLRRTEVDAELASGVSGSLVTSDEALRVSWTDPANVHVDAVTTKGTIDAAAWSLTATTSSIDTRLDSRLGTQSATAPRVSLRNQDATIVIGKSSRK